MRSNPNTWLYLRKALAAWCSRFFLAIFLAVWAIPCPAGAAEADRPKHILVLQSFSIPLPAHVEVDRGLKAGWQAAGGPPVKWDTEYLDLVRFGDPGYLELVQDLLRRKYGHGPHPVDMVIPVFPPAIKFYLTYGESILQGVPVVICGGVAGMGQGVPKNHRVAGTIMIPPYRENVQLILSLNPKTRRIVFVAGAGDFDRKIEDLQKVDLKAHPVKVETDYLNDFSFQDLKEKNC